MRSAIRIVAIAFGIVVALAGLEHGIGEILQGRVRPPALVFESWPESRFLEVLSGEPAMSVIPNLLVSGILTVIVSLGLLLWSATGLRMVHPGVGLIALSFLLLLVGGGLGPPLMLLIVGLAATRIEHPVSWWRKCSVEARPPILARGWRAILMASLLGYLALLPGIPVAEALLGPLGEGVVAGVIAFGFASFFLAIIAALAADSYGSSAPSDKR